MLVIVSTLTIAYQWSILYNLMRPDHLDLLRLFISIHKLDLIITHISQLGFLIDQLGTIYSTNIILFLWRMIKLGISRSFRHSLFMLTSSSSNR